MTSNLSKILNSTEVIKDISSAYSTTAANASTFSSTIDKNMEMQSHDI